MSEFNLGIWLWRSVWVFYDILVLLIHLIDWRLGLFFVFVLISV